MMRGKGKDKGKGKRKRQGGDMPKPGVLLSWEDFDEAAMREYLDAVARDLSNELDEQERSFRSKN